MKNIQSSLTGFLLTSLIILFVSPIHAIAFEKGNVKLQSIGPIATGPDGILFVSDPKSATITAIKIEPKAVKKTSGNFKVTEINTKVAAVLGTSSDQVRIIDLAVDSNSQIAYLSVMRGQGSKTNPAILSIQKNGTIHVISLQDTSHSIAKLPNAPEDKVTGNGRRKRNQRMESITDIAFINGKVIVAGLSNEEFSSTLRSIPFPFKDNVKGTGVKIFHGAHGRYETASPVRTFVSYDIDGDPHLLAAYTCTPLVKIPMKELNPGARIEGKTIAELGNRNRPLDMIVYKKNGKDFLLMANSSRGVMKISTEKIGGFETITERVGGGETEGVPYETVSDWTKVYQLAELDNQHALVIRGAEDENLNLEAVLLP